MKNCIGCNSQIEEGANFCPGCGTNQGVEVVFVENNNKSTMLIVLCVLTICGSLFTIGRAIIYELFAAVANEEGIAIRATLYILTSVGTIVGAILMLGRRLVGLYVYTVCQVIYIITTCVAAYEYRDTHSFAPNSTSGFSVIIIFYFGIPALIFLIVYWLKDVRKYLR